jgi:hypothetical protein
VQVFNPREGNIAQQVAMRDHLNAIPNGDIVVIWTFDEPRDGRVDSGLPAAMYRCGASRAVFGSSQFRFRSAYILVGVAGSGEGMGAEVYSGAVDSDPNAWCELGFQIQNGVLTVSGANGGARSLYDLGPVQTDNMAEQAINTVPSSTTGSQVWVSATGPSETKNFGGTVSNLTFVNTYGRTVQLEVFGSCNLKLQVEYNSAVIGGTMGVCEGVQGGLSAVLKDPAGVTVSVHTEANPARFGPLTVSGQKAEIPKASITRINVPVGYSVEAAIYANAIITSNTVATLTLTDSVLTFGARKV